MAEPYIGEIRIFAGNFPPLGWEFCAGQLLPIEGNEVLFQLIGTTYGGDGQNTYALPDLRGRLPLHQGTGSGLSSKVIGQNGGVETITLNNNQIPVHGHTLLVSGDVGTQASPENNLLAQLPPATTKLYRAPTGTVATSPPLGSSGGSQPHSNFQPYLCLNFIISMFGIFPSQ
jgi:microcystin-dependent protein